VRARRRAARRAGEEEEESVCVGGGAARGAVWPRASARLSSCSTKQRRRAPGSDSGPACVRRSIATVFRCRDSASVRERRSATEMGAGAAGTPGRRGSGSALKTSERSRAASSRASAKSAGRLVRLRGEASNTYVGARFVACAPVEPSRDARTSGPERKGARATRPIETESEATGERNAPAHVAKLESVLRRWESALREVSSGFAIASRVTHL